ncbi:MAG: B12-binding domain-containing radical SAM protein [Planctomycetes bacterium]|nr:B12-binding domain-containing radical SAM protein [Planctomycetota bacterium]
MRVLFVYPNLYTQMGFNHGLASLSAVLKDAGHATRLVNLNEKLPPVPTREEVVELVREWAPGLVAFSCLTQQYGAARELAEFLRAALGDATPPLVVGGIHPTMVPDEVMADGVWDHVGVGECEDALLALVTRLAAGEAPDDVPNFLSWRGGTRPREAAARAAREWVKNPVGAFPDYANLPEPDYALFDTQRITDQKHGWFGLMSSRGCPYRCTYCLNHKIVDRYKEDLGKGVSSLGFFRFRPADKLIAEIRRVLDTYTGIGTFIFDDDLFTQNVEHALAICAAYEAAGIGVPFVVNAHVKKLDPRVAEALGRAGGRILKLGIESGSPRVRARVLKRHMTDRDIDETVASAEAAGLHTSGFVMVGLPSETPEELWETVDCLARTRIGRFRTSFFFPFPGTEGWDLAIEHGHVGREEITSLTTFTDGSALDFGPEQNLLVDKLGKAMPWFVNARLARFHPGAPASARYATLVERVLAMDAAAWEAFKPCLREVDAALSADATANGELHYAIRYNDFMGVRSDWFLAEEQGLEWTTAAARPAREDLERAALAAAAAEVS